MSRFLINNVWFLGCANVQSKISCFCLPKTQRLMSWNSSNNIRFRRHKHGHRYTDFSAKIYSFVATNTTAPQEKYIILLPQTRVEIIPRFKNMLRSLVWQPGHKHIMWIWPDTYCINVNMVWHITHTGVNVLAVCWKVSCLYQHMCGRCLLLTCFWHCTRSISVTLPSPLLNGAGSSVDFFYVTYKPAVSSLDYKAWSKFMRNNRRSLQQNQTVVCL